MEYLRTDTVSVGTLYRKAAKLSRGAGAYFCKHFVPAGAQGGRSPADLAAAVFAGGGLAFFAASLPCLSGSRRGLGGFGRLPALPLVCFLSPIPPAPLPGGKGETKSLFRRGLRPRHPCIRPVAALTASAMRAPRGRTHGSSQKRQEAILYEQCRQPRRGGTGGEELRRLRWSSPPGQGWQATKKARAAAKKISKTPFSLLSRRQKWCIIECNCKLYRPAVRSGCKNLEV